MTTKRRGQITSFLRQRTVRALQTGTMRGGDRLPSTRAVAAELGVDPRLVLAAYRELAAEGLVELRERSGAYVAADSTAGANVPGMAERWVVDIFAEAIGREVAPSTLLEWMRHSLTTRPLRAGVIAGTEDQLLGLCRELESDYGLETEGVVAVSLGSAGPGPAALDGVDLVVATEACGEAARAHAARLGAEVVIVRVRADLISREWVELLRKPVYVVATDAGFVPVLRAFFAGTGGADNLHPVLLGRDSLSSIPAGAITYITQSARERLGDTPVPGRVVPPARVFSPDTVRELLGFIVRKNWEAMRERASAARGAAEPGGGEI